MKLTLAILSLVCCGCLATEKIQQPQKRSVGLYDGIIGESYGLPIDTSISSHTHTHTTSVIEKPVIVQSPTITTTKIVPDISSTILSSPSISSFGSYGWPSTVGGSTFGYGWPSTYGKIYSNYGKFYPSFGKTYSSGYGWPSTFTKSYYSSPIYKPYRW